MAKVTVQFTCAECGTTSGRWLGKCPGCGAFGSLVEELHGSPTARASAGAVRPVLLRDVRFEEAARISTGVAELDRVLGGGIVPGSLVLVGGEPGVGKSTLLLTALGAIAHGGRRSLLVTGEESAAQVSLRAARLGGTESVEILAETELDTVCATLEAEKPDFGIGAAIEASPITWMSFCSVDSNVAGLIGHQSPCATPAAIAMAPALSLDALENALAEAVVRRAVAAQHVAHQPVDGVAVAQLRVGGRFLERGRRFLRVELAVEQQGYLQAHGYHLAPR